MIISEITRHRGKTMNFIVGKIQQIVVKAHGVRRRRINNAIVGPHGSAGMVVWARWSGLPFEILFLSGYLMLPDSR
jgi:hypothetical protein